MKYQSRLAKIIYYKEITSFFWNRFLFVEKSKKNATADFFFYYIIWIHMGFPYKWLSSQPRSLSLYSAAKRWILPSFIFNWISNINLLSIRDPFVPPSSHSTFQQVTLDALLGCFIIHQTDSQPKKNVTTLEWTSSERFLWLFLSFIPHSFGFTLTPSHCKFKAEFKDIMLDKGG